MSTVVPMAGLSRPAGARGLKLLGDSQADHAADVAPRRGAWIETSTGTVVSTNKITSRPAGARGLKQKINLGISYCHMSRPAGARGLKLSLSCTLKYTVSVAPRRGAWIETFCPQT